VYEAIRNSPVWKTSLLIIVYDEHGGFYDHVKPGCAIPPGDGFPKTGKHGTRWVLTSLNTEYAYLPS
jgi:phospholipase C